MKFRDVARDNSRIEAKFVRADDTPLAECLAHDVQQLMERASRPFSRAFRPQIQEQPLARETARIGGREQRQESQPLSLSDRRGHDRIDPFDRQAAEGA